MLSRIEFENRTVGEILSDIHDNNANNINPRGQGTQFEQLFLKTASHIAKLEIENI